MSCILLLYYRRLAVYLLVKKPRNVSLTFLWQNSWLILTYASDQIIIYITEPVTGSGKVSRKFRSSQANRFPNWGAASDFSHFIIASRIDMGGIRVLRIDCTEQVSKTSTALSKSSTALTMTLWAVIITKECDAGVVFPLHDCIGIIALTQTEVLHLHLIAKLWNKRLLFCHVKAARLSFLTGYGQNELLLTRLLECMEKLEKSEAQVRELRVKRDKEMKCVVSRLLLLEGEWLLFGKVCYGCRYDPVIHYWKYSCESYQASIHNISSLSEKCSNAISQGLTLFHHLLIRGVCV